MSKQIYPGESVSISGQEYKVMAVSHDGKIILRPSYVKETTVDMMTRLQSTVRVSENPAAERPESK